MFIKRDNTIEIEEVIERNTGMKTDEFLKEVRLPYIKNLKETIKFVKKYIADHPNCTITIVGDYDSDGVNATAIMYWVFTKLGVPVVIRVPKRISEGYGLNPQIIDEIESGLVITVDNGIAATEAIQKAKNKGLTVVVTDHHLPKKDEYGKEILPNADMIINTHLENDDSEFKDFCGAGIAYAFAREMFPDAKFVPLLVLASIATVTDVMPLVGANRTLVKDGLAAINNKQNVPGVNELIAKLNLSHIDEYNYGFDIGPTFNAAGRLLDNGSNKVIKVLTSKRNNPALSWMVQDLVNLNNKRKEIVRDALVVAESLVTDERPICIYDSSFQEGIVGIIAGQLCEKYNTPCIVFTDAHDGGLKGSGRSTENIHLKQRLDAMQDTSMFGYGGHAGAAGVKIFKASSFNEFKTKFVATVGTEEEKDGNLLYDLEIQESDIDEFTKELNRYAPFGEGNPKPIFHLVVDVSKGTYRVIGDGSHFSIWMGSYTIMGFKLTKKYVDLGKPQKLDMICTLAENWFNGKCTNKVEIIDFEVA